MNENDDWVAEAARSIVRSLDQDNPWNRETVHRIILKYCPYMPDAERVCGFRWMSPIGNECRCTKSIGHTDSQHEDHVQGGLCESE